LASPYPVCAASIPSAAIKIPCACSCRTGFPHHPWRRAHSRSAPLQADHVPHTGAGRAGDATQRLHRLVHAAPIMELVVVQIRVATPSRNPEDRQGPQGVEVGHDERRFELLGGIVHRLRDRARAQHLAERVHRPVVNHDPPGGSFSRTSSRWRPRTLCGLIRALINRPSIALCGA
jgi:hypothetical protein